MVQVSKLASAQTADASAFTRLREPMLLSTKGRRLLDRNAKVSAFELSQVASHDHFDTEALLFNLDPEAPAYITPSMGLTNHRLEQPILTSTPAPARMVPCQLPGAFKEPPGLERMSNASTTLDSLPSWSTPSPSLDSLPSPRQFMNMSSRPGKPTNAKANQGSKAETAVNHDCKKSETMKAHLEELKREDPACVFIARGINKLGFGSPKILRAYFSRYGEVKAIHVSPSRVKSMYKYGDHNSTEPHWRLRAAPLGFIVMKSADATARILADGPVLDVNSVPVRLQPFNRHSEQNEDDQQ